MTSSAKKSNAWWGGPHTGRLLILLIVVISFTLVSLVAVQLVGGAEQFRNMIQDAGPWAPAVYVLLKASTYIIAPLSGTTVKLASGALFGTWEGMLFSLAGDALGGTVNYWVARTLGRKGVTIFVGKKALHQVDAAVQRVSSWRILLAARLALSSFYDFISYAAGLARFPFGQFFAVTVFGGIPISLLFAVLGNATVESGATNFILMGISAVLLVAACVAYVLYRRQRPRTEMANEPLGGE
jgi:uncharacterized membrane protein YdjX (TVP38/TMEM64 family)